MSTTQAILTLTLGASLAASAAAQPDLAVYPDNTRLREVFSSAKTQRIALVGIGDSNQLYNTDGWENAWFSALRERYGIWGTALISAGEDFGWSSSVGTGASVQPAGPNNTGAYQFANAPEETLFWMQSYPTLSPAGYLYVRDDASAEGLASPHGMLLNGNSGLNLTSAVRFSFTHALFPKGRDLNAYVTEGGVWDGIVVDQAKFNTQDPSPPPQGGGDDGGDDNPDTGVRPVPAPVVTDAIEVPPNPGRNWWLRLRFGDDRGRARGPFFLTYMQAENPQRTTGAAVHTLYGLGGASSYDMAAALMWASDQQLSLYFSRIRAPLGPNPRVVVRINTGVNDRAEWMPSFTSNFVPGNFPAAYRDNIDTILTRIRSIWALNHWDAGAELNFLITVSHPLSDPDDTFLNNYRWELRSLADRAPDVTLVDLSKVINANEMSRRGWYITPEDHYHLNAAGHIGVAKRELIALLRTPCFDPADIDSSGAVNTRDLLMILEDFATHDITPGWGGDLDNDGDCDTADLVQFLGRFGSTTCNGD